MKKHILLSLLLFVLLGQINAQNKNAGKLRIAILNPEYAIEDSCLISIYSKEGLLEEFKIDKRHLENLYEKAQTDRILQSGEVYTIVVEGILKVPVIFTNIKIRKKKMFFFQVDCKYIHNSKSGFKQYLIIDYNKFKEDFEEILPQ